MPFRIEIHSDNDNTVQDAGITMHQAPVYTSDVDPNKKIVGDWSRVPLPAALVEQIKTWINNKAAGIDKYTERLNLIKTEKATRIQP